MRILNDYHPWNVTSDFSFPTLCCSKSFAPYHKGYSIFLLASRIVAYMSMYLLKIELNRCECFSKGLRRMIRIE